jgi:hypothetical protein
MTDDGTARTEAIDAIAGALPCLFGEACPRCYEMAEMAVDALSGGLCARLAADKGDGPLYAGDLLHLYERLLPAHDPLRKEWPDGGDFRTCRVVVYPQPSAVEDTP